VAVAPLVGAVALELLIAQEVVNNLVGQLVGQIVGAALVGPITGLQAESFRVDQSAPISADAAVDAYIKGHLDLNEARDQAALTGISNPRFDILAASAGEPIPLLLLAEAWRRGIVPKEGVGAASISLEQGIRESRLKNKWIPIVEALQFQLPPIGTVIEAWLRAQATKEEALGWAYKQGVDEQTATLMFKAAGRPPSPQELFTLLNRGVIEETGRGGDNLTLEQGYLETDLKDKWYEKWKALREYRPPPRTITALSRAGAITDEQALKLYQEEGLTPEMAAIYVKTAHHERHAAAKELTKAEWVAMYVDQAITQEELLKRLATLGFTGEGAQMELTLADLKVDHALQQRAVNRVGNLYVGRRIDKAKAMTSLDELKLPPKQRDRLLAIWTLERRDNLKHLTPAEISLAVKDGIFGPDEAMAELGKLGYGPRDAWIILSTHLKSPVTANMPSDNLPPD
jgi:hypothetical protein